jgi:hypothetical protein
MTARISIFALGVLLGSVFCVVGLALAFLVANLSTDARSFESSGYLEFAEIISVLVFSLLGGYVASRFARWMFLPAGILAGALAVILVSALIVSILGSDAFIFSSALLYIPICSGVGGYVAGHRARNRGPAA